MTPLTNPNAGGEEEFYKTNNQKYQYLTDDAAQIAYNLWLEKIAKNYERQKMTLEMFI